MTNTTDKSILTAAGKALLAQLNAEEKPLIIDKMFFANVPNRPEFPQPDDVVPSNNVVHEAAVEQRGRLSVDSVIYSTTLTSQEGPFEFNWTGAYCSEYGVLVTIDHHALTPKTVDEPGVSGNTLVRSVVLEYKDIAEITNITVDASSWQYNATPRMKKMDNDTAQAIIDQNGKDWFIEDGFLVTPQSTAFNIKAGAGYVSGNRVTLDFDRNVQVPNKPSFIFVDAHREGTPTGEQVTLFDFVVTAEEKDDYVDEQNVKHFVCKIAQVLADGSVSDMRPEGETKKYVSDFVGAFSNYVFSGVNEMQENPSVKIKEGAVLRTPITTWTAVATETDWPIGNTSPKLYARIMDELSLRDIHVGMGNEDDTDTLKKYVSDKPGKFNWDRLITKISSPLLLRNSAWWVSQRNQYRTISRGIEAVGDITAVEFQDGASGGRIDNLGIKRSDTAKTSTKPAINFNPDGTNVIAGVDATINEVTIQRFKTGVKTNKGFSWNTKMFKVLVDRCQNGFDIAGGSANVIHLEQCIALLGSDDETGGALTSIGYNFDDCAVKLTQCAAEANYTNVKLRNNSLITFDQLYLEAASQFDINIADSKLYGNSIHVFPTAAKFNNSMVIVVDVSATRELTDINVKSMYLEGSVNGAALVDMKGDAKIKITQVDVTKADLTDIVSPTSKYVPDYIGFVNSEGKRWHYERITENKLAAVAEVEQKDINFVYNVPMKSRNHSGVSNNLVVKRLQRAPDGTTWEYIEPEGYWRHVDVSTAGVSSSGSSGWNDKALEAGRSSLFEAFDNGVNDGSGELRNSGVKEGDTIKVKNRDLISLTVVRESDGLTLATLSAGETKEFTYSTDTDWILTS
ncbi:phage tail protein [Photobacterium sagamiensis]|uniref:phage tail-collar fiber domain-containing protein n=1 Tax=Photobacterium sagamiensis TaxID=2910241 RepID=UPI003D0A5C12